MTVSDLPGDIDFLLETASLAPLPGAYRASASSPSVVRITRGDASGLAFLDGATQRFLTTVRVMAALGAGGCGPLPDVTLCDQHSGPDCMVIDIIEWNAADDRASFICDFKAHPFQTASLSLQADVDGVTAYAQPPGCMRGGMHGWSGLVVAGAQGGTGRFEFDWKRRQANAAPPCPPGAPVCVWQPVHGAPSRPPKATATAVGIVLGSAMVGSDTVRYLVANL